MNCTYILNRCEYLKSYLVGAGLVEVGGIRLSVVFRAAKLSWDIVISWGANHDPPLISTQVRDIPGSLCLESADIAQK